MKNKRAQSEVITTVLIILLVLAAVFIVYTAVRNMVQGSTDTATDKAKCIGLAVKVNSATAATKTVQVQRDAGGDEAKVTPVILVAGAVVTATCTPTTIGALETSNCGLNALTAGQAVKVGGKYGTTTCDGLSDEFVATA